LTSLKKCDYCGDLHTPAKNYEIIINKDELCYLAHDACSKCLGKIDKFLDSLKETA
jgi:hypothetical protein